MECKICNKMFKAQNGLAWHTKKMHNMSILEYRIKYEGFQLPLCDCGKQVKIHRSSQFAKTCGSKECMSKIRKETCTEETKEKIRKARVEYLKKRTGQTAWERRASGKLSYLEQWFLDEVIDKHRLNEKYDIVNEYCEYPYFIDFAFMNCKVAVELDGKQHFINGKKRIECDKKKDRHLNSKGWSIFRIRFDENTEITIKEFLRFLSMITSTEKIFENRVFKYREIKPKKKQRTQQEYFEEKKQQYEDKQRKYVNVLLDSGIDFSKFGWVGKVAKIIEQPSQKVNSWMKRFMPEFYEENCFKRK